MSNSLLPLPDDKKILFNDSIDIANTGSSTHSSGSLCSAVNIDEVSQSSMFTSGDDILITKVFDLGYKLLNQYSEEQSSAIFGCVCYTKDKPFTLISVNQIMKKGYKLSGDYKVGIKLTKGNHEIKFNFPILLNGKMEVWGAAPGIVKKGFR